MRKPNTACDEEETSLRRSFLAHGAAIMGGVSLASPATGATKEHTAQSNDEQSESEYGEAPDLNEADIEFLQQMITHHWEAVTMAELVPLHSSREPLIERAAEMKAAQSEQIDRMEEMLKAADVGYQTDNVPEASEIPGMPTQDGMATLRTVNEAEFNLTFINLITAHHRGAMILANRVLKEGQSELIAEMAQEMITSQEAEIYTLYEWYLQWAPSPDTAE